MLTFIYECEQLARVPAVSSRLDWGAIVLATVSIRAAVVAADSLLLYYEQ